MNKRPTLTGLRTALDPPLARLMRAAEAAAIESGCDLWVVGGAVRDLAVGARVHDLDLAVRGPLPALVDALARHAAADAVEVEYAQRFGTATVHREGYRADLAHLRTENYVVPGALPDVRLTDGIEADLRRRDFTVNAVALGLAGVDRSRVVDPFGGLDDLQHRVLRVLHERSFVDDATRLWRGARTASLFGLAPDPTTRRLIEEGARWLESISGERLWAELANTARRGRPARTVALLDEWGVLRGTHSGWTLPPESARALRGRRPMPAGRLAAVLLAPLPQRAAILQRLSAPREVRLTVEDTARLLEAGRGPLSPGALAPLEGARAEARLAARWLDPECQPPLQGALSRWERTRPALDADTLIALGVPRGPEVGRTLGGLRRARYLGTLGDGAAVRRNARAEVLRRLERGEGWD